MGEIGGLHSSPPLSNGDAQVLVEVGQRMHIGMIS
jgi:hypothetical protein